MKTIHLFLTLTLVILGSAAKAQYIPLGKNVPTSNNYYGGKGAYPSSAFRQKAKLVSSAPATNILTPTKPKKPSAQVIKKSVISHLSMINGYTLVAGEDQRVYGGR